MDLSPMTTTSPSTPLRPGNSGQSVGHMAKAAVAEARAGGADLPRNAQGLAASSIARGIDPASVFAALITPEPEAPAEGSDTASDIGAGAAGTDGPETPLGADDTAGAGAGIADDPAGDADPTVLAEGAGDSSIDSAETALALLRGDWPG